MIFEGSGFVLFSGPTSSFQSLSPAAATTSIVTFRTNGNGACFRCHSSQPFQGRPIVKRIDVVRMRLPWRTLREIVRGHRFGDISRASFNLSASSAAITRIQCGPSHGIVTGVGKFFDAPILFVFGGFSFTKCRHLEHHTTT